MIEKITLQFFPKPPFDFAKMMHRQKSVGHEMYRFEEDSIIRTIRVGGRIFLTRTRGDGDPEHPVLTTEIEGSGINDSRKQVEAHLRAMFSMDLEMDAFYAHMSSDERLAPLAEQFRGLRLILEAGLFECMTKTIIGQQLNLAFAAALNRRLMELVAEPFASTDGNVYPVFPTAEQVASVSYEQLRELQFSQRKAEYVIDFARSVASGELDLEQLKVLENDQIMDRLVKLRGIGRWSVECFLMFGMGRLNLLPAADIGLRNAVKAVYNLPHQPAEDEVRKIGSDWAPWSSYYTFYLWEYLGWLKSESKKK